MKAKLIHTKKNEKKNINTIKNKLENNKNNLKNKKD